MKRRKAMITSFLSKKALKALSLPISFAIAMCISMCISLCISSCSAPSTSGDSTVGNDDATTPKGVNSFYNAEVKEQNVSQTEKEEQEKCSSTGEGDVIFTHSTNKGKIYHHKNYSFSYSEEDEQSEWVAYELEKKETYGSEKRCETFTSDPIVVTESANNREYCKSGYTRGHLAPAGDMKFDRTAMRECFYTSNISPQTKEFNAGIWNDLENETRFLARKFSRVYVVTGPVLTDKNLRRMKYVNNREKEEKSRITVPERFYKIIYDFSYEGKEKMIAFLIPQDEADGDYKDFVVSVDEVEKITGIDFFTNIPKEEQERMESRSDISSWPMAEKRTYEK